MNIKIKHIYYIATIVFFMSIVGAFNLFFQLESAPRFFNYLFVLISLLLLFWVFNKLTYTLPFKELLPLIVYFGYIGFSLVFSDFTFGSAVKLFYLIITLYCSYLIACIMDLQQFLRCIFLASAIIVISSFFMMLTFPSDAYMEFARGSGLSGIYAQKNSLGRVTVVFLALLFLNIGAKNNRFIFFVLAAIGLTVLYLTASRTSGVLFLLFLLLFILNRFSIKIRHVTYIALLVSTVIVYLNNDIKLDFFNGLFLINDGEINATGRLVIWNYLFHLFFEENIMFGLGFDGIYAGKYSYMISKALGWKLTDAHNGFFEVLIQLGVVGTVLFVVSYFKLYWTIISSTCSDTRSREFIIYILLFSLVVNMTSSHYLEIFSFVNFLLYTFFFYSIKN